MMDAIAFLESLGRQGSMGRQQDDDHASAAALLEVDAPLRAALERRDVSAVGDALGAGRVMVCMVATPDGSENDEAPERKDDDDDDRDDKDTDHEYEGSDRARPD